jgi:uncharacterized protein YegP (UPF0339 family)
MIEINVDVLGLWRWKLYDENGLILISSREFKTRKECEENIKQTKEQLNRQHTEDDYPEFISHY